MTSVKIASELVKIAKELAAAVPIFDVSSSDTWINRLKSGIKAPVVGARFSEFRGQSDSIMLLVSLDEKKDWKNGILENSCYFRMRLESDGTLEMFGGGSVKPAKNFRKTKVSSAEDVVSKINK